MSLSVKKTYTHPGVLYYSVLRTMTPQTAPDKVYTGMGTFCRKADYKNEN